MLPVVFNGAQDSLWNGRRGGNVRARWMKSVLISSVRQRDLLAIRCSVREPALRCDSGAFGPWGAWGTALVRRYAGWGVVAVIS